MTEVYKCMIGVALVAAQATVLGASYATGAGLYLVIAAPSLVAIGEELATHRGSTQANCYVPLQTVVVSTATVDQTWGDQDGTVEPIEIRACVDAFGSGTQNVLRYVVLIGSPDVASESGVYLPAPTDVYEGQSDDWYFDRTADTVADVAFGRISALSAQQADAYIQKVIEHDLADWHVPSAQDWRSDVLVTAYDQTAYGHPGYEVLETAERVWGEWLADCYAGCGVGDADGRAHVIGPWDADYTAREAFTLNAVNAGVGVWIAFGTAANATSLVRFLRTSPPDFVSSELTNVGRYPWLFGMSCDIGTDQGEAEVHVLRELMFASQRGVVGATAPSGGVGQPTHAILLKRLLEAHRVSWTCEGSLSMGESLLQVKQTLVAQHYSDVVGLARYRVCGDPALRLPMRGAATRIIDIVPNGALLGNQPYAGQWVRRTVVSDDRSSHGGSVPHRWTWTANKGEICGEAPGYEWADCNIEPAETIWYRCQSNCGSSATLTAGTVEWAGGAAYPCNAADTTFTVQFRQHTGGCPIVQVFKTGQWTDKNSVLSRAVYDAAAVVADDYYLIQESNIAASPVIDFRIREATPGEVTTLDFAELWVVDHPTSMSVWTSLSGTRWQGTGPSAADVIRIKNGPSVKDELQTLGDDSIIAVAEGDTLMVVFPDASGTPAQGLLELHANRKPTFMQDLSAVRRGIRFASGSSCGEGDILMPREEWYPCVVDSPMIARGDGVPDTVMLEVGEYHQIDRIALIENATEFATRVIKPLTVATHSTDGNVLPAVSQVGGSTSTVDYGEHVQLRFSYPTLAPGNKRELILRVRGTYAKPGQGVTDPIDSETRPWVWGIQSMAPNPTTGGVFLTFNRQGDAPCALQVFDVGGRRVRTLLDNAAPKGAEFVYWDGRNGAGRRVAAGVYFLRLSEGSRSQERKVVIIR